MYLVSNNLKPQRRFTMTGLLPSTEYHLQVEAHNIAGSSTGEYSFYTLTKDGGTTPRGSLEASLLFPYSVNLCRLLISAATSYNSRYSARRTCSPVASDAQKPISLVTARGNRTDKAIK